MAKTLKRLLDAVPSTDEEKITTVECARACSLLSVNADLDGIETWLKQVPPVRSHCVQLLRHTSKCGEHTYKNLSHSSQVVRLRTLRVLARANPESVMLRDLLYIERNGRNPMQERNIRARTEQIAARLKSKLVSESDVTIMIKHVLGLTNIRYQRLWPTLKKLLQSSSTIISK